MSEFVIKSSTLNSNYEFKDVNIIVSGNYQKNAQDGKLISISGECYRNVDGNFGDSFGYFNGYPSPNSDEMSYDLSQMKRADNNIVWDAIEAIEAEVLPTE